MVKVYYMSIKSWISVVGVVVAAEVTGKRIDGRKSRGDESAQERRPLHIVDDCKPPLTSSTTPSTIHETFFSISFYYE